MVDIHDSLLGIMVCNGCSDYMVYGRYIMIMEKKVTRLPSHMMYVVVIVTMNTMVYVMVWYKPGL
jgi:hypothetical protein